MKKDSGHVSDVELPDEPYDGLVIEFWDPDSYSNRVRHHRYVFHENSRFREALPHHHTVGHDFVNQFVHFMDGQIDGRTTWNHLVDMLRSNRYGAPENRFANEKDAHANLIERLERQIDNQRYHMNQMEVARRNAQLRLKAIECGEAPPRSPMTRATAMDLLAQYCSVITGMDGSSVLKNTAGMFARLPPGADEGKVMRWLGYIQGVLVSEGFYDLEQVKEHAVNGTI